MVRSNRVPLGVRCFDTIILVLILSRLKLKSVVLQDVLVNLNLSKVI